MGGPSAIDEAIRRLAAGQHGVVARRQLLRLGLGTKAIDYRVRTQRLVRVERGVYALGHAELRPEGRILAVVLSCGDSAVLSHRSAAGLWGMRPRSGAFVEVTASGRGGQKERSGVRLHRSADLPPHEVTTASGIPTTTPSRTLLDLAAVVPAHHLRRAVERADQLELFDLREVERVLDTHPSRPGRRALTTLLDDLRAHGATQTRSDLEAAMLQLCLDHRLPRPQVNRYDGTREVDFRWPDHRLVVEVDGWTYHRTRAAFDSDRARDRELLRAGWRVARFTDRQIARDPNAVAHELTALLTPAASAEMCRRGGGA
jgi:very-short-patch-repair endonuclease